MDRRRQRNAEELFNSFLSCADLQKIQFVFLFINKSYFSCFIEKNRKKIDSQCVGEPAVAGVRRSREQCVLFGGFPQKRASKGEIFNNIMIFKTILHHFSN